MKVTTICIGIFLAFILFYLFIYRLHKTHKYVGCVVAECTPCYRPVFRKIETQYYRYYAEINLNGSITQIPIKKKEYEAILIHPYQKISIWKFDKYRFLCNSGEKYEYAFGEVTTEEKNKRAFRHYLLCATITSIMICIIVACIVTQATSPEWLDRLAQFIKK